MASQNINPLVPTTSVEASKKSSEKAKLEAGCHSVKKRLQQELMSLMVSGDKGVSAFPSDENIFSWIGTINGACGTVIICILF
ncbi:ubiquitin-conjugating enzyme E2 C-like [Stegodyphus dumicola]|uniref:ubiquitin-conjugating enzyme E2 C-like n=1 Tax=Stegodyphus dumicola TaxID=202533 RepID=UPI0015AFEC1C|nr:ubiquitin-conjugating enzyme E2 C-like [Stegodyphus dumicola]